MESTSLTNLQSSMVHDAVGILLQFRKRDVEQEEEEEETQVRAMERLELLKCVLYHYFQHKKVSRDYKFLLNLSSWALKQHKARRKQREHQWSMQDGCLRNTREADERRDGRQHVTGQQHPMSHNCLSQVQEPNKGQACVGWKLAADWLGAAIFQTNSNHKQWSRYVLLVPIWNQ